jgi:hypothetical protein
MSKSKIVRTESKALGGITPEEKIRLDAVAKEWIDIAMRTRPIDPSKIVPAIEGIYAAAKLRKPRVVIVPSPLVMAFAYGASAWIWYCRKNKKKAATDAATRAATRAATEAATRDATDAATLAATLAATRSATDDATDAATRAATHDATHDATNDATRAATLAATDAATRAATRAATDAATRAATLVKNEKQAIQACIEMAGEGGIKCSGNWYPSYQGGNMWAGWSSYSVAFRDVLGLKLKEHKNFSFYEDASREGGFRVMHEEFCMVCDFPEVLKKDDRNLPHCEDGPSHRWRDGWSLYHWHGVRIPDEWIEDKKSLSAKTALTWDNIEQRRAACEIVGWNRILKELNAKIIDKDVPEIGTLLEVELPDFGRERFLRVRCGTNREFAIPVPKEVKTAMQANAWTYGLDPKQFSPEVRT